MNKVLIASAVIISAIVIFLIIRAASFHEFYANVPTNYFDLYTDDNLIELPDVTLGESIPKVFHRTHETKETLDMFKEVEDNIRRLHPDYKITNYTTVDIEEFIKTHYSDRIYKAYKSINPNYGAARADVFRYLVVYLKGGIYMDIKSAPLKNLDPILEKAKQRLITTQDRYAFNFNWNDILFPYGENSQWVISSPKGHNVLKHLISQTVKNIENDYKDKHFKGDIGTLALAGPTMYTLVTNSSKFKDDIIHIPKRYGEYIKKTTVDYYGEGGLKEKVSKILNTLPYEKRSDYLVEEYNQIKS